MDITSDKRIVLTLDAGGTNFVFGAMMGGKPVTDSLTLPSNANDLKSCLNTILQGFQSITEQLTENPVAISFAFPGPSDYNNGIIGDLLNLPAFRGGIALKDMLEDKFHIPVFIQNDGDLYAYGEAIAGILPEINAELEKAGMEKRFHNLVGLTLGTGFGAGLVHKGQLISGDNSVPGEIWNISNSISPQRNAEEGVSTRAIIRHYTKMTGEAAGNLMPADIFKIAKKELPGDSKAAEEAFYRFGLHLGDAIANLIMLFDGIVVMGGGLTGAQEFYTPGILEVLKGKFENGDRRLYHEVYNLDNPEDRNAFYTFNEVSVKVPFSNREVKYYPEKKTAIASSRLGASEAIATGAYAYALAGLEV